MANVTEGGKRAASPSQGQYLQVHHCVSPRHCSGYKQLTFLSLSLAKLGSFPTNCSAIPPPTHYTFYPVFSSISVYSKCFGNTGRLALLLIWMIISPRAFQRRLSGVPMPSPGESGRRLLICYISKATLILLCFHKR